MKRRNRRGPKRRAEPTPETVISNAIFLAADRIARKIPEALAFFGRVSETIDVGCPGKTTLFAIERGDGWAIDYEFGGKTRAQVRQDAITEAENDAKENVRKELERKIALVQCATPCKPVPGKPAIKITRAGRITDIKPDTLGLFTGYYASAMAEGSVVVECK